MEALFEGIQRNLKSNLEFQAALQGVDLSSSTGASSTPSSSSKPDPQKDKVPLFGDPSDYQSIPLEEREKMTESMMAKHKAWSGDSFRQGKGKG